MNFIDWLWVFLFVAFILLLGCRLSIRSTGGKWVWGIAFQFETCGCKHVDLVFGLYYLRADFGYCRRRPRR
jgi:hypothetical protein